ncbi:fructose-specific PTS system transporter subunit IIC [Lactiplantibacillus paraplantarum]|uniref:Fructose-specific PTS system transporter subunit IIC n=1 Tax=Lactiplantibacillus paraplantarum TaxID=60520 RepID=A0ABQ0NEX9_9LACO|nr:PTS fructose transporter subunit IIC [Lactiplantibacillus paraplantarum]GBF03630.1 fructose-specific PTS system transporter subunit IIC [Lactiplantibacillus paraplantarum]
MLKKLQLKKHAMTAISYMLPLVVASGLLIAIGNLTGGTQITKFTGDYSLPSTLTTLGVWGMGLLAPVISAAIAYSIADRPGIAPGLLSGIISYNIGAGFLGGMLGGFITGWVVAALVKYVKVPKWAEGLKPMMIVPLLSSLIMAVLMFYIVGQPIVWATNWLTTFLNSMQGSARFLFGSILGGMAAFDFGGPVNKVASLFADGMLLQNVQQPEAVKILASMVPPFGVSLSWLFAHFLRRRIYTKREEDNIKIAFPMGIVMITEGVIPIAAVDLIRVVISCTIGAAIGGGLSMAWGIKSPVPSGGLFIVPAMNKPLLFCLALLIGSLITAVLLLILKKRVPDDKYDNPEDDLEDDEDDEEVNLDDIKIN